MAKKNRYTLESYVRPGIKHTCPNSECGQKEFTRYIYADTGKYVADEVGICNRKIKCRYHYWPSEYFKDHPQLKEEIPVRKKQWDPVIKNTMAAYIPKSLFQKSVKRDITANNFVKYLLKHFTMEAIQELRQKYFFGTAQNGSIIYWQIDVSANIRAGKIINYDPQSGNRLRNTMQDVEWVHKKVDLPNYSLNQCFYGERLIIKYPDKPIAIVESEKTAIICDLLYPDLNWLAAGSMDGLSEEKCKVLKGKCVYLFPDVDAQDLWVKKAQKYKQIAKFVVSTFLFDSIPIEKRAKQDVADYLLLDHLFNQKYQVHSNILIEDKCQVESVITTNIGSVTTSYLSAESITPPLYSLPELKSVKPTKDKLPLTENYIKINNISTSNIINTAVNLNLSILPKPLVNTESNENQEIANETEIVLETKSLPFCKESTHQKLLLSPLRKLKFLLSSHESESPEINFYLLYRLITANNQGEISALFSDKQYFSKGEFMYKLPDLWSLRELKTDGISLLNKKVYSLFLYYLNKEEKFNRHNGLMYFSIPLANFETKKAVEEALEKVKLLQNVVFVYLERQEYVRSLNNWSGNKLQGNIHLMVYFGEFPYVLRDHGDWKERCFFSAYDEHWTLYAMYLKLSLNVEIFYDNILYGMTLCSDSDAWFNADLNLIKWDVFVSKYNSDRGITKF